MRVACAFFLGALACGSAPAQPPVKPRAKSAARPRAKTPARPRNVETAASALLKKVSLHYGASGSYAWDGVLEVAQRHGEDPKEMLASAKIKLEAAPGPKYYLHVEKGAKTPTAEFDRIADGAKSWTYIPSRNEYTERPIEPLPGALTKGEIPAGSPKPGARDWIEEFSLQLVPALSGLSKTAEASFLSGMVLTAVSKKDANGYQDLFYLTVEPDTLAISKVAWVKAVLAGGEKSLIRGDINFEKFRMGEPIPDSRFAFDRKTAKLVDLFSAQETGVEGSSRP